MAARTRPAPPGLRLAFAVWAHWAANGRTLRQGATALAISTVVGLAAGLVLGAMEALLEQLPGLLLLVPAAIGMRGAIFGALAARLGTGILTGQLQGFARGGFGRDNLEAAILLTLFSSALAALVARAVAGALGLATIPVWELMVVSVVGGVISSAVILVGVMALTRTAQRRGWDMDAIGAPLVTTTGDIITLPALVGATLLLGVPWLPELLGGLLLVVAVVAVWRGVRAKAPLVRAIVRQSLAVLTYAAVVDILAGSVLETRVEALVGSPALLVLIPPFIANCGSLGGILAARLGSELHLGMLTARVVPERLAFLEGSMVALFGVLAFGGVGLIAHTSSVVLGFDSPGLGGMVGVALLGGALAFALIFVVAYATASASFRFGWDPDNHGIPVVTATMDLFGVLCLIAAMVMLGVI
ncbi:MAG: magnesium transporter [Egibacteraceae bacterium]